MAGVRSPGEQGHHPPTRDYARDPLIVTWEVTQACELQCDHCRAAANPHRHPDELTTQEGKAFIDQLAGFDTAPVLVFSGGDPLERPDLFELIDHGVHAGLRIGVTPAPTTALTDRILNRFKSHGVSRVALSLDGASAHSHDAFRGEEGSFETIQRAATHAPEIDLPVQINTTVTARTVDELPGIVDLVAEFGAVMWEVFFLVPIGRGTELEQLSPAQAEDTLAWLYEQQRRRDFRVITVEAPHYRRVAWQMERREGGGDPSVGSTGDGNGFIFVSHTGEIYPSGFLPISVGNVREVDPVDSYRNAPLLRLLRNPDKFHGACGLCPHRYRCGGSRARAFATSGDPLGSDPLCTYFDGDATPTAE